jgi:hypothetical protein
MGAGFLEPPEIHPKCNFGSLQEHTGYDLGVADLRKTRASQRPSTPSRKSLPSPPAATSERGRPALPAGQKRDQRLVVKLRLAEVAQLKAEAEAAGLPLALYARLVLMKRTIPDAR